MSRKNGRDGESEAQTGTVEWDDVSDTSDGIVGSLLGGIGNGSQTDQSGSKPTSSAAETTQRTADAARSDEAQAFVQSILNGLQEPTVVVDTDGRITHINDQALTLYECTEQDAIGTVPHGLQADGSPASNIVSEAIERTEDIQQREETILVAGQETPLERTVTLLYDSDGALAGAMLIEKDVTERNRQRDKKQFLEQYQQDVLDDLQDKLARFAEGDLTIDPTVPQPEEDYDEAADVYDEFTLLNDHLNRATDNIRGIIETLTENADKLNETSEALSANSEEVTASIQQIDASSTELATGADDLAENTQRANENIDDLSASIEEITATIQQIDSQSKAVADIASNSVDDATETVDQIREATDATSTVAQRINSLEDSMEQVDEIITMIADIADQTNMLALNANIEAARAGEAGEGFAVVANEVKDLAEESQESADQIAGIITDVQTQTADLVESITEANDKVENGADEVEELAERLKTIDERAKETSDGIDEITDAVESQAENAEAVSGVMEDTAGMSEEITASIQQISVGVDEQSDAMEEVAANAQQLSAMSDQLHGRVDVFKLATDENANLQTTT
jgi:PAS domain S-box-containing protein